MKPHLLLCFLPLFGVTACGIPSPPSSTGGAVLEHESTQCSRALVVANSNYKSTSISMVSAQGEVLSPLVIHSGAPSPSAVSKVLSGDVVLPHDSHISNRMVLIDRAYAVLTWIDVKSGQVSAQLSVGTGFRANPQDYLEVAPSKAYVSRGASNPNPGQQPFDKGADILVLDPAQTAILKRIEIAKTANSTMPEHPERMLRVGEELWVSMERMNSSYQKEDARLVGISIARDERSWSLELAGVAGCGGPVQSPSGKKVAISCQGSYQQDETEGGFPKWKRSQIVLLDATQHPPVELERYNVAETLQSRLNSSIAFANENTLVGTVFTEGFYSNGQFVEFEEASAQAFALDLEADEDKRIKVFAKAISSGAFGQIRCRVGCKRVCFLTDAKSNCVRMWTWTEKDEKGGILLTHETFITVDAETGLPPQSLGEL